MKFTTCVLLASAAAGLAAPSTLQKREDFCGQWDLSETPPYTVYNNLWNMNAGTGEQCTGVDGINGNILSWHTSWTWSGGQGQVKSYPNAVVSFTPTQISAISSLPTTWKWTYTGSDLVANVAYDLFTSSSETGTNEYEIMIWLAGLGGAGPISETGSPVATVDIDGVSWSLFEGFNGDMHVFSFVAGSSVENFSGDLINFTSYLADNHSLPTSQYVLSIGGGTEPFSGTDAVFTAAEYSVEV
ncbi:hypothetical protein AJ79_08793 [Helicocarpus griseus UAMH5409]|uniref:xyloglucan-specific endo-beta-1,4-glucanase n=1 Tax=Helicocarpus griseus UAMH5409 TaxID=1447875 RepID=A0A2B7WPY1_9EURO|nr:hypothetical protein AJ79_08793 [Helicocarpus griseus UAMH5409]